MKCNFELCHGEDEFELVFDHGWYHESCWHAESDAEQAFWAKRVHIQPTFDVPDWMPEHV